MQIPSPAHRSGVYKIVDTTDGRTYVGSSIRLKIRAKEHASQLIKGIHGNPFLQRAWDKHGAERFEFEILLYCSVGDLLWYEQRAMDAIKPEFNICAHAASTLGTRRSAESRAKMREAALRRGFTDEHKATLIALAKAKKGTKRPPRSQEWLENMSKAQKGRKRGKFTDEHRANLSKSQMGNQKWLGRTHTEETKAKMSIANRKKGRLTEDQVRSIRARCLTGESQAMIAQSLGVSRETVSSIHNRKVYAWVT